MNVMRQRMYSLVISLLIALILIITLYIQTILIGITSSSELLLNLPILMVSFLVWSIFLLLWFIVDWLSTLVRAPASIKNRMRWILLILILFLNLFSFYQDPVFGQKVRWKENNQIYSYAYNSWQSQYIANDPVLDAEDRVEISKLLLSGSVEFRNWDKLYTAFRKQKISHPEIHFKQWYLKYQKQWFTW